MKIVDVSEFYSPTGGGVRAYVDRKFDAAARLGVRLTVIAPGTEDRIEQRSGGKLIWTHTPQLPFDKNYRMFWGAQAVLDLIDAEKPDVLEGSSPWRGGWIVGRWKGPAVKMLFMHADPVAVYPQTLLTGVASPETIDRMFGWYWAYLRRLASGYDNCVVAGSWLARRFAVHGLRNLCVVPFGVETKWFTPALRDDALRADMLKQCGLRPDAALVLNIGRHHPEKRVPTAIDAVTIAQRTRPVGLHIIGDGFIHGSIVARAARAKNIHVAGWIQDRGLLARMIASADVLLHCSSAETFGFAVAETMCCGTPVVVPSAGGAADLAAPEFAESYPPGDAEGAAKALLRMLSRDRAAASSAAAKAGQGLGDIESHFEKLFAFYRKASQEHRDRVGHV